MSNLVGKYSETRGETSAACAMSAIVVESYPVLRIDACHCVELPLGVEPETFL